MLEYGAEQSSTEQTYMYRMTHTCTVHTYQCCVHLGSLYLYQCTEVNSGEVIVNTLKYGAAAPDTQAHSSSPDHLIGGGREQQI